MGEPLPFSVTSEVRGLGQCKSFLPLLTRVSRTGERRHADLKQYEFLNGPPDNRAYSLYYTAGTIGVASLGDSALS
jgi:hypothetical protein